MRKYRLSKSRSGGDTILASFTAGNDSDAETVAQSYATIFNVSASLISLSIDGSAAADGFLNTYSPASQGSTVSAPTGVTWISA